MSVQACAELVYKGDPARFRAVMAMPLPVREVCFPIFAFALEVARAPWVTQEPMIAEMRLQWWRDALEEIAEGGHLRRHEVVTPLADVLSPDQARRLDGLVAARRWDIYKEPFESPEHLEDYLEATAGRLLWACAEAAGAPESVRSAVIAVGWASGLARFLQAVPVLQARGRFPLLDPEDSGVRALATQGLVKLDQPGLARAAGRAGAVLLEASDARAVLRCAQKAPVKVFQGALDVAPATQAARLFWRSFRGWR